jgi:isopentenyl phosphate kinase (EC 2.7.4.-)
VTTILKLGGSVVTEKAVPETVDEGALETAASALGADPPDSLVLVHGGGSFGHHYADAHDVSAQAGTTDPAAVAAIHAAMGELNAAVVDALQTKGLPAVPVRPLSAASKRPGDSHTNRVDHADTTPEAAAERDHRPAPLENDAADSVELMTGPVQALLAEEFVPVLHGDVVATRGRGCTIASGDALVAALSTALSPTRVGLCTTVPGVLDADDRVIDEIDRLAAVTDVLGGADTTDVTGGMAGKIETLLAIEADASVFGLEALPTFLAMGAAGTVVR